MALFNKFLVKDDTEEKLKQEIKSLEFRKESVSTSINKEIAILQSEQKKILYEAGKHAYMVWCDEDKQADLTDYWNKIQDLEEQIEKQEAKKGEMIGRYDEEINLIASNLNPAASVADSPVPGSSDVDSCPKCGAVIAPDDIFCQSCGTKLK